MLIDAGLDACRISLNSAHKPLYEAYYQPIGYGWEEVEETIRLAKRRGVYTALNVLTFPGVTDQEEGRRSCARWSRAQGSIRCRRGASRSIPTSTWPSPNATPAGGPRIGLSGLLGRLNGRARGSSSVTSRAPSRAPIGPCLTSPVAMHGIALGNP